MINARKAQVGQTSLTVLAVGIFALALGQTVGLAQSNPQQPQTALEIGQALLYEGVPGLASVLQQAGVPPLTFDQETQVQSVWEAHDRERRRLVEENGGIVDQAIAENIANLEEQVFLASIKFLNPAQRNVLSEILEMDLNTDLPEDPGELREYLGDLCSPGGGGGISIDGFGGGQMPDRDEIQEIRINENAFTSEQSRQGRGQTQIITRGGSGQFRGTFGFNFADESLDARNAFASFRPPYQRRNFNGNFSGPVIRNRLTLSFSLRDNTNERGETLRALTPDGLVSGAATIPSKNRNYSTTATAQISENHVANWSFSHGSNDNRNFGVGGFGLPEQAFSFGGNNFNFQIKETAILSSSLNNEVRFRVSGGSNSTVPATIGPNINVIGAFRGGGSTASGENENRFYEFGELLMYTGQNLSVKAGFEGIYNRNDSVSRNNFNGTFTFSSLDDFIAGKPILYNVNRGETTLDVDQFQTAMFVQSDFRLTSRLAMGFGLRYETQTNVSDNNNLDPRLGFAYSISNSTVLRGGTGIFHQRLNQGTVTQLIRFDGTGQESITISNPAYPNPFVDTDGEASVSFPSSTRVRADDLATPYTWNSQVSLETTFDQGLELSGTYSFVRGVHLYRSRNINAPTDITASTPSSCRPEQDETTCQRPDPSKGNVYMLESTGLSSSHDFDIDFRQRLSFVNINGGYSLSSSYGSGGGPFSLPEDNHDLAAEWGRNGSRHRFNVSVNFRLPWNINADTRFNWNSGNPYNLRTGRDDNQDQNTNDRPEGVPRNSLTGPGFSNLNLNLSKAIQLRSTTVAGEGSGPAAAGGYYGQRRGVRMTIRANANNILNQVNFQSFSGVMTSPFFGKPTRARNPRQISLSLNFNF